MYLLHKLIADHAPQESAGDEFEDGEVDPETDGVGRSDKTSTGHSKDAQDRCPGTYTFNMCIEPISVTFNV